MLLKPLLPLLNFLQSLPNPIDLMFYFFARLLVGRLLEAEDIPLTLNNMPNYSSKLLEIRIHQRIRLIIRRILTFLFRIRQLLTKLKKATELVKKLIKNKFSKNRNNFLLDETDLKLFDQLHEKT